MVQFEPKPLQQEHQTIYISNKTCVGAIVLVSGSNTRESMRFIQICPDRDKNPPFYSKAVISLPIFLT